MLEPPPTPHPPSQPPATTHTSFPLCRSTFLGLRAIVSLAGAPTPARPPAPAHPLAQHAAPATAPPHKASALSPPGAGAITSLHAAWQQERCTSAGAHLYRVYGTVQVGVP